MSVALRPCLLLLLVVLLLPVAGARAATYYVRAGGQDQADGKSAATAWQTLRRAAEGLNAGERVVIGPGVYRESVLLAERFAADGTPLVLTGDESGKLTGDPAGPVVLTTADAGAPALRLVRLRQAQVSGLTFRGPGQGLVVEDSQGVTVSRCTFSGCARGLVAEGTENLAVESCVFARCTMGVVVNHAVGTRLAHLTLGGSVNSGVLVLASGPGSIRNCLFAANNTNYVADRVSAPSWSSDYNALQGPTGPWGAVPSVYHISEWFAASGQERHSVYVLPGFAAPDTLDLHVSPLVTWGGGLPGMDVGLADPPAGMFPDRDGRPFRVRAGRVGVGAYDYPDPQPGPGWQPIGQTLAVVAERPRQSAAVVRADGALVRTLLADAAGVTQLWWDGLDELGQPAAPGPYRLHTVVHDVRVVDDGAVGDNGNPLSAYNPDNADRVAVWPDGRFALTAVYDEAGYTLRTYSSSGHGTFASNFAEGGFWGVCSVGADLYGGQGQQGAAKLVRLAAPGERAPLPSGALDYPVLTPAEAATAKPVGLAIAAGQAYVAIAPAKDDAAAPSLIRVIALATGKPVADWPLPAVRDVATDPQGRVWAISGTDVVRLAADGTVAQRLPTGLATPQYLAASVTELAVVDRQAAQVAVLAQAGGAPAKVLGKARVPAQFNAVATDLFRDPRGCAWLPDGRLLLTEQARVRAFWPATGVASFQLLSNFMDSAVVHPTQPQYLYCSLGVFQVDPQTGAWDWLAEEPQGHGAKGPDGKAPSLGYGAPHLAIALEGRPFIAYTNLGGSGRLVLLDVSDPLHPRLALDYANKAPAALSGWAYSTISFTKDGDLLAGPQNYSTRFKRFRFLGLDAEHNPNWDFANPTLVGEPKDASARGLKHIEAISADRVTGDLYFLAVTEYLKKMVPGWGADGTGVARATPEGQLLWFAPSSGGNYMSISTVDDGKATWVLAGKSFGGQLDLFDRDGLRLATGAWGWPAHYGFGFVDLRYGVHAYLRPDGKVGAYVEDDAIGRFGRARLDGMDSYHRDTRGFTWAGPGAPAASAPPFADHPAVAALTKEVVLPKVASLAVNGDWAAWDQAGITPQIVGLASSVGFNRAMPADLLQTGRAGTYIGALAHDGANLYACFVVADDSPRFDAAKPDALWMFDGLELWVEEEQFGLGFIADGTPSLWKWRFHDPAGTEWKANYGLPRESIWGQKLADLSTHPLGQRLATLAGVSLAGKPGYALMAKIPFSEVKLVGGIAGRSGITPLTGAPGEVLRIAVSLNGVTTFGRTQEYQIDWPVGKMFSDPTRSYPCVLGK